jgi:Domain of unknown function (DUF6983)
MIFEIPIDITKAPTDGEVTFDVELDGATYRMQFGYAECSQLWYMSIFLQANTETRPITQGVACVTGMPLLADVQVPDRPAGELILAGDRDAGRDDLGKFVRLTYFDAEEMAPILALS